MLPSEAHNNDAAYLQPDVMRYVPTSAGSSQPSSSSTPLSADPGYDNFNQRFVREADFEAGPSQSSSGSQGVYVDVSQTSYPQGGPQLFGATASSFPGLNMQEELVSSIAIPYRLPSQFSTFQYQHEPQSTPSLGFPQQPMSGMYAGPWEDQTDVRHSQRWYEEASGQVNAQSWTQFQGDMALAFDQNDPFGQGSLTGPAQYQPNVLDTGAGTSLYHQSAMTSFVSANPAPPSSREIGPPVTADANPSNGATSIYNFNIQQQDRQAYWSF